MTTSDDNRIPQNPDALGEFPGFIGTGETILPTEDGTPTISDEGLTPNLQAMLDELKLKYPFISLDQPKINPLTTFGGIVINYEITDLLDLPPDSKINHKLDPTAVIPFNPPHKTVTFTGAQRGLFMPHTALTTDPDTKLPELTVDDLECAVAIVNKGFDPKKMLWTDPMWQLESSISSDGVVEVKIPQPFLSFLSIVEIEGEEPIHPDLEKALEDAIDYLKKRPAAESVEDLDKVRQQTDRPSGISFDLILQNASRTRAKLDDRQPLDPNGSRGSFSEQEIDYPTRAQRVLDLFDDRMDKARRAGIKPMNPDHSSIILEYLKSIKKPTIGNDQPENR